MISKIKRKIIIGFFVVLYLSAFILKINVTLDNADFVDFNARNIVKIENIINLNQNYSFIAVGNIMNSIGVFENKMLPLINSSDADFVVFTGNSVLDGANDKYGALYRTIEKLEKPALFVLGAREISDHGLDNYFKHIGSPSFFFVAGNSEFIFMDTTGNTDENYQLNWVKNLLDLENVHNRFVFMSQSPLMENALMVPSESNYSMSDDYKNDLMNEFESSQVSAVISSSDGVHNIRTIRGTKYISTGGGGGVLDSQEDNKYYHYTLVKLNKGQLTFSIEKPEISVHSEGITLLRFLWNKIYSWIYVNFINVLLIISVLFLLVYEVYIKLIESIDYYPDVNNSVKKDYPLTIAMFTNNYLPFIGGVPLSISRLKKGLENKGHKVYIFAPEYNSGHEKLEEKGVIRFSPLFYYKKGDLIVPVSNIFSSKIRNEFKNINPDIVHVHHPFWLGTVGKRLAQRYKKPIVFTYHTRLEQYNHYVPFFKNLAGGQIPHLLIKYFASSCDAVIAPTKSAKRYLRNLGIGKLIMTQPTGIDLKTFHIREKSDQNRLILFSVFRLSKEKSPYFLLKGIEKLSKQCTIPFQCLIAGTGPEEENMANYIKNHNMEKYVLLLGKISPETISDYYTRSDIFIFSSESETQGMVILEAMAGGSPVVAVDSSGISDIVTNSKNGFKTEADLDQWVSKIQYLMENGKQREILGNQARQTAEMNSIESMSDNILDMYFEIIDWKKKHPNKVFIR